MSTKVLKPISERSSVLAFEPKPIPDADLQLLFEASRWAPSSYNEQPWKFYYASRSNPEAFAKLLSTLVPANAEWAANASVLIISAAKKISDVSGGENYYALHDTALAEANLILQAQSIGLASHIMGGFSHEQARSVAGIPDAYHVVAAIAIGYPGNTATLSPANQKRALSVRSRKAINEVFVSI